jgi:hypothetical protein
MSILDADFLVADEVAVSATKTRSKAASRIIEPSSPVAPVEG